MVDRFDLRRLTRWLADHHAPADLVRRALLELRGHPGSLSADECEFVLVGLLRQVAAPAVDLPRLDGWVAVARDMGLHDEELAVLVEEAFGTTVERVWAFGQLHLAVDASAEDVKATHRTLVKLFHPDRMGVADPAAAEMAHGMVARVNAARATLLQHHQALVPLGDDLVLGEPVFLAEDAPTELFPGWDDDAPTADLV